MSKGTTAERLILLAPGAGAPSSSPWMQGWRRRLGRLGSVRCLDYPYQLAGRRSPDRHETLVAAHRAAFDAARAAHPGPVVLAGKSMGSRIGCHLAVEVAAAGVAPPAALVCLGYPLVGQRGAVRDEVLMTLSVPILFVQGTRDRLCPIDRLEEVRRRMRAPSALHVVEGGDHSLTLAKGALAAAGRTQADVDEETMAAITAFLDRR